eukprot:gi/632985155/ref/XP_007909519.1/ PREDICTED: uncharacterized protein LOC103190509 isoform X2 [Callorhinchus milii]
MCRESGGVPQRAMGHSGWLWRLGYEGSGCDGEFVTSQTDPEKSNVATFTPSEISAGNLWCKYSTNIDGRELKSLESDRVGIFVRDPLQKPTIWMKSDSRMFARGKIAQISCSGNYPGSNFSLYRDGEFITSQRAPQNKNTATFTQSNTSAGNYSCKYTAHIGSREFTSPESEQVGPSMSARWTGMLTLGLSVGIVTLTVITGLILGICEYKRVKHNSSRRDW